VLTILKTRTYTGSFLWAGKVYKGTNYKPIISKALWEKVQKVLSTRAIRYASSHISSAKFFKYRGLLTCAYCGCAMTPMDLSSNYKNVKPGDPGSIYYRCTYAKKSVDPDWYLKEFGTDHSGVSRRKQKIGKGRYSDKKVNIINCPQLYWKEEEIDDYLRAYLRHLVYDKDVVNRIREILGIEYQETMSAAEVQRKGFEAELKKKQMLKKGLVRKLALEEHSELALEFHEEIMEVKTEIETIKAQIDSLDEMSEGHLDEIMDALTLCSDISEKFDKLDAMGQRRLVMMAFKKITLRKGRIRDISVMDGYVDAFWTDPFDELHDKWFMQVYKEDLEKQKRIRAAEKEATGKDLNKSTKTVRRAGRAWYISQGEM
ncbi:MAG: recombinase zinc beta ribbon domain-containing protein, partial [Candidatus Aminicenantaceae bacterium]